MLSVPLIALMLLGIGQPGYAAPGIKLIGVAVRPFKEPGKEEPRRDYWICVAPGFDFRQGGAQVQDYERWLAKHPSYCGSYTRKEWRKAPV